jgi:hypothetical protein
MAKLERGFEIIGTIKGLNYYRDPITGENIVRSKPGPTRKQVKNSPSFAVTRKNNTEFGGCGRAGGVLHSLLEPVVPLADFNFTPGITGMMKRILSDANEGEHGKRSIPFSRYANYLRGFTLNRKLLFDQVARNSLTSVIDRGTARASITVPPMVWKMNFNPAPGFPVFRFIVGVAGFPDLHHSEMGYGGLYYFNRLFRNYTQSAWRPVTEGYAGETFEFELPADLLMDDVTLFTFAGLQMGQPVSDLLVTPQRKGGCAKILATG